MSGRAIAAAASVAAMALTSFGLYSFRGSIRDAASLVSARAFAPDPGASAVANRGDVARNSADGVLPAITAAHDSLALAVPAITAASPDTAAKATASADLVLAATAADSVQWMPAVARTWVNVRSDARRGGDVIGVINPAARAMLGTTRAGWRQVKSPDVSGWVDPKLFEPDPARSRGL